MKHIPYILLFIFLLDAQSLKTPFKTDEYKQIVSVLVNYAEGAKNSDPIKMKASFHESSSFKHVQNKGNFANVPIETYLSWFKKKSTAERFYTIASIDFSGRIAQAKMLFDYPKRNLQFIDYIHLLKIDGKWQIVHKIAEKFTL